jgi:very-short-patch-repair endonuclease
MVDYDTWIKWQRCKRFRKMKSYANKMKRYMTSTEYKMWESLREVNRILPEGYYFKRQWIINKYILDFYCEKAKLCVEVDGIEHNTTKDAYRDKRLKVDNGIDTMRITNDAVFDDSHRQAFVRLIISKICFRDVPLRYDRGVWVFKENVNCKLLDEKEQV